MTTSTSPSTDQSTPPSAPHSALQLATVHEPAVRIVDEAQTAIVLTGAWDIRALQTHARLLQAELRVAGSTAINRWDLSGIERLDHIGALLIWRAWGKRRPAHLVLCPEHETFFVQLGQAMAAVAPPPFDLAMPIRAVGAKLLGFADHLLEMLILLGQTALDTARMLRRPWLGPWREVSAAIYRTGTQALGITAGVGFLIGVVLSYLSSEQLKSFGANVFIINILGIGVIRELGPVLCAVLVAGRSGSAITAQLGVMRVTEELDALSVMGIPHTVRLVLPRVLALAITLPLLIVWTTAVALVGGAIAAQVELGITVSQFLLGLPAAVPTVNVAIGVGKGVVFGVLIGFIACHFGLRIQPNTESLGAGTTNSVVSSITAVIIADALFALVLHDVGIAMM